MDLQDDHFSTTPRIVPREQHVVSRRDIDPDALKVLYRLARNHFTGYLVGGGVRDLLLGRAPKDYDIGTDATPAQIRRLFRNSRIIGRRFPLVHVYFRGGKTVEVSTFRQNAPAAADGERIVRDDRWGTPAEDAWRRDLTINGLFYDIETFSVIDYVGGLDDLERRVIRTIGDPYVRFREDPVRMIRAIRHAARTDFEIEPRTWQAIRELSPLITTCAAARVLEEFLRELRGGAAAASLKLMSQSGLLVVLAPPLEDRLRGVANGQDEGAHFWRQIAALDHANLDGDPMANAVSLSVVFGSLVQQEIERAEAASNGAHPPDFGRIVRDVIVPSLTELGISRRDIERCFHIVLAGRRLRRAAEQGRIPAQLERKSYFPESWTYLQILLEAEGWDAERVEALRRPAPLAARGGRPRRRRRRRSAAPPA
jgi:poly(A) polymerase